MKGIKSFLIDYILKKINVLRKRVSSDSYVMFGTSEEVVLFRSVLFKDSFTNDDINDLLICYSDHVMGDSELLEFVSNNGYVYYEMDEACINFDIRNIIIYYLLQSSDFNVVLGVFKLFSNELVEMGYDRDIFLYGDLNIGDTLYDLYSCYNELVECNDRDLKIKKAISLMALLNIEFFKDDFRMLGVTYEDIDNYIDGYEKNKKIDSSIIKRLLDNMLLLEDRTLGDNKLTREVLIAYKNYSKNHLCFNLGEFIRYYNSNYDNDFSYFYYNKSVFLDVEILYSILTRKEDEVDSFTMYGEYLDKVRGLTDINYEWQSKMADFCNGHMQKNNLRRMITVSYFNIIENLKKPIDTTLNYYIYLNVPEEYRDTFYEVIRWYYNRDNNYFGRNIFVDNDDVKKNTFLLILEDCKKAIYEDFKHRKFIHKEYLELIRKMIGYRYITIKDWNEYLYNIAREYYVKEGILHIGKMLLVMAEGESLLAYQEENFEYSEFKHMCTSLRLLYPDMSSDVLLVSDRLNSEIEDNVITNRNYKDEIILQRHSKIIRRFIESDCVSKTHFLKVTGIGDLCFERSVNVVREYNPELYGAYRNKIMHCLNRKSYFDSGMLKK